MNSTLILLLGAMVGGAYLLSKEEEPEKESPETDIPSPMPTPPEDTRSPGQPPLFPTSETPEGDIQKDKEFVRVNFSPSVNPPKTLFPTHMESGISQERAAELYKEGMKLVHQDAKGNTPRVGDIIHILRINGFDGFAESLATAHVVMTP